MNADVVLADVSKNEINLYAKLFRENTESTIGIGEYTFCVFAFCLVLVHAQSYFLFKHLYHKKVQRF